VPAKAAGRSHLQGELTQGLWQTTLVQPPVERAHHGRRAIAGQREAVDLEVRVDHVEPLMLPPDQGRRHLHVGAEIAAIPGFPERPRTIGTSLPGVCESPLAKTVTSWPRSTSPAARAATTRSVPPYPTGGTAFTGGATSAIRSALPGSRSGRMTLMPWPLARPGQYQTGRDAGVTSEQSARQHDRSDGHVVGRITSALRPMGLAGTAHAQVQDGVEGRRRRRCAGTLRAC